MFKPALLTFFVITFLTGCGASSTPVVSIPAPQAGPFIPSGGIEIRSVGTTFESVWNCGSGGGIVKKQPSMAVTTGHVVEWKVGGTVGAGLILGSGIVPGGVNLKTSIEAHTGSQEIRSLEKGVGWDLPAEPNTEVTYTLQWREEWQPGYVDIRLADNEISRVAVYYRRAILSDIVDKDVKHCGDTVSQEENADISAITTGDTATATPIQTATNAPEPTAPFTPIPTNTPTSVPPTPTPLPTNTPSPTYTPVPTVRATRQAPTPQSTHAPLQPTDTPASTPTPSLLELQVGQSYEQGNASLLLKSARFKYGTRAYFDFRLTNISNQTISFKYSAENFTLIDNLGRTYQYYSGIVGKQATDSLEPGDDSWLHLRTSPDVVFDGDFTDPQVEKLFITVTNLSSIDSAQWVIPVAH